MSVSRSISLMNSFSRYVHPENSNIEPISILTKDVSWYDRHVFQSQYLVQILKCSNVTCCKPRRSSLFKFIPPNGLPAPIPIRQTDAGLRIADVDGIESYASLFATLAFTNETKKEISTNSSKKVNESDSSKQQILYDQYCPSVQSKLSDRTCDCGRYFSSVASMKSHLKVNVACKSRAKTKRVKAIKLLGKREEETMAL